MTSNKLINESSPYLQQHAHNPVDWFPWGDEALTLAKDKDKPILVSIGYSACHWCHVMERESFEDPATAAFMNEHFINIKIDREERPDLDHIYMEAVQVMTGSGGWPLNVFLTPALEPFYGGTYFPPKKAFNHASWMDVLEGVSKAWKNNRVEVLEQAGSLVDHLKQAVLLSAPAEAAGNDLFSNENAALIVENILKVADKVDGGFGKAPKFPQTFSIQNLLFAGTFFQNPDALQHAHLSLKKMIRGGIYDQLGGGFARYATDSAWLVPHFEKMLYDNALLLSAISEAYQVSGDEEYSEVIRHTIDFLRREMRSEEGGYYAALDADSEGEEGKFYVWSRSEADEVLQDRADLVSRFYGITENGNWEGKNILTRYLSAKESSAEENIDPGEFSTTLVEVNAQMMNWRNKRVRPHTDDKILLAWNAFFIISLCNAHAALGDESFRMEAVTLYDFCTSKFSDGEKGLLHTYKNGEAKISGNLEDYASIIGAALSLQEISGDPAYLEEATGWMEYVIDNFSAPGGLFYFTRAGEPDILFRKTEIFDGAVPSANSLLTQHLLYLGVIWDKEEWRTRALSNLESMLPHILKHPTSFGVWAKLLLHQAKGVAEVVVSGKGFNNLLADVLKIYLPNKVLQVNIGGQKFPLLRGKGNSENMIHICKNYTCLPPMSRVKDYETYVKNRMIR